MLWKYLRPVAEYPGFFVLDHRLVPEVSAMFAAMSSRMPLGGIEARYGQIIEAVAETLYEAQRARHPEEYPLPWEEMLNKHRLSPLNGEESPPREGYRLCWHDEAEEELTTYPLHPKVQEFFNQFVLQYGHSSILELSGQPAVYTEGISWYSCYLLFDSALCAGQEFSTRAVRHKDWPMARECYLSVEEGYRHLHGEEQGRSLEHARRGVNPPGINGAEWFLPETRQRAEERWATVPHPTLKTLHDEWFEVFEAEVEWWRVFFTDADNRATYGIKDKEPFRPALDRARWAIPGTISTGCCHTGNLRERSRVLNDGLLLAQRSGSPAAINVWEGVRAAYVRALPGMAGMGLREAVYDASSAIPAHLNIGQVPPGEDVRVNLHINRPGLPPHVQDRPSEVKRYLDPAYNHLARVDIAFQCSLAVSRDWHRHRTMYPWLLSIVRGRHANIARATERGVDEGLFFDDEIRIHPAYKPKSSLAEARLPGLLVKSTKAFDSFMAEGNQMQAMLCLPLGTLVQMSGQAGLRDSVYLLELRRDTVGANFEYQDQATRAMELLSDQISRSGIPNLHKSMGLQ